MEKRKPSFLLILVHVTTEKLLALFLAIVSAGLGLEQWKKGVSMTQAWFWWVFAIFLLILIVSGAVREYQKELESYNSQSKPLEKSGSRYEKSPHAEGSHIDNIVYGDTKNFNSNNTSNTSIGTVNFGSGDRTKKDLRLQIGIELQVFDRAFHDVVRAHFRELHDTYGKADQILEKLTSDLFFRANLLLTDTPIPEKLFELRKYYNQYSQDLFIHHSIEGEIRDYIIKNKSKKRLRVPPELEEREQYFNISVNTNQLMVQYIVRDILELCKE